MHKGSCLCGSVNFEIDGDFESFFLCHCKHCQKDTGSAYAANLFSTKAKLKWISGKEHVKTYNLPGTRHAKSFCSECSSAVPNEAGFLQVPAGSLDTQFNLKPNAHIFCSSSANWERGLENIQQFEKFPN
ncbi:GFA family protein [Peredibacter starrii]|uniref:GFA family protein n=1 Tax=Peredibacter starrii TaxID=28202 RepID=A0AAX4HMX2_9BACT|nr:GFA family protein [Peredibacter starrii]WPU64545.1 GFA family protein [Peredibacter starrii]